MAGGSALISPYPSNTFIEKNFAWKLDSNKNNSIYRDFV